MILRDILFEESINTTKLYTYSSKDADQLEIDPKKFGHNPYTKKDKNVSDVPRSFFYLNPKEKEPMFGKSHSLYMAEVASDGIYSLITDPLKLKDKFRNEIGRVDLDELMKFVSGWRMKSSGWEKTGTPIAQGLFYNAGFDVVIWFSKIVVDKVPEDLRVSLENEK